MMTLEQLFEGNQTHRGVLGRFENNKKVALIEMGAMGGTCVNVGCVPKKIMWNSVEILSSAKLAPGYGFENSEAGTINWKTLK